MKPPYQWQLTDESGNYYYVDSAGIVQSTTLETSLKSIVANWNEITFKWVRNTTYWGVFRAQSPDAIRFAFDGAKILRYKYYNEGVEGKLRLVVNTLNTTDQLYYNVGIFDIDFSQFKDGDYEVEAAIMQGGLTAYLKAYDQTKITLPLGLSDTTKILTDGCNMRYQAQYSLVPYYDITTGAVIPAPLPSSHTAEFTPPIQFIQAPSSIPAAKTNSYDGSIFGGGNQWLYESVTPYPVNILVNGSFPLTIHNTSGGAYKFILRASIYQDYAHYNAGALPLNAHPYSVMYTSPSIASGATVTLNVTFNYTPVNAAGNFKLQPGNIVVILFDFDTLGQNTVVTIPQNTDPNSGGNWPFVIDSFFQLNSTFTPAYRLPDVWKHLVEQLGYLTSPSTLSAYWGGGGPVANFRFASSFLNNPSTSPTWLAKNWDNSPYNTHVTCADALAQLQSGESVIFTSPVSSAAIAGSPVSGGGTIEVTGGAISVTLPAVSPGAVYLVNGQVVIVGNATVLFIGGNYIVNYGSSYGNVAITTSSITLTNGATDIITMSGSFVPSQGAIFTFIAGGTYAGGYQLTGSPILFSSHPIMLLSINDIFKDNFGRYGVGLGIETRSGNETVVVETLDYFLDAYTEIGYLGEIEANSMHIQTYAEPMGNSFSLGYKRQTYDKLNGADEFNSLSTWVSNMKRINKKIDLSSNFRADMYGVEFARLNLNQKDKNDPNTNNDIFLLQADAAVFTATGIGNYYKLYRGPATSLSGLIFPDTAFNIPLSPGHSRNRIAGYLKSILTSNLDQKLYQVEGFYQMSSNGAGGLVKNSSFTYDLSTNPAAKLFSNPVFNFTVKVPINLPQIMATNPRGVFRFTYRGNDYSGFVLEAGIIPGLDGSKYQFKLLSSPLNNLTNLII